ncbi:MAG: MATE family efflux transporter [Lachnospiraceae bacterium]|nr:MATE family efflux transporter [Lachnospiraceae bacterium]
MRERNTRQLVLTDGPILKTLMKLAAPIMATAFLSTAYNLTDAFWVGTIGAEAVAGVGTGGMYLWLSVGFITLARTGGQVYTAQSIGAGDHARARGYARAAVRLALILGLCYGLLCFFAAQPLLSFFRLSDAKTYAYAYDYLRITGGLVLMSFLSQVLTGLFTAQGDSRTPFICNVLGLAVNMILDPLLITGAAFFPRLEAVGAALATVAAQAIVLTFMLLMVFRNKSESKILYIGMPQRDNPPRPADACFPMSGLCSTEPRLQARRSVWSNRAKRNHRPPGQADSLPALPYTLNILRLSFPHAIQTACYCMFSMVLARMISAFGSEAIAVQRIGGQIEALSWNVADGFAASLNAFTAQNVGAGKPERYRKGYYYSALTLFCWGSLIALAFFFGAQGIAGLFFHEESVIIIMISYLTIISICEPFMCVEILTVGALSALERTKLSGLISITLTGARIPLAFFLTSLGLGIPAFWWALTITSVLKGIVFFVTYRVINK